MGNSQATPMTRDELRKARQSGQELVEEITVKVWEQFGQIQRDHPDLDQWQVVYRLDLDLDEPISEKICKDISKRVAGEYIGDDYPYELSSIDLLADSEGHYVVCIFQEENTDDDSITSADDVDDDISFDSDLSVQPQLDSIEVNLEDDTI